jgi:hypothetical protein
MLDAPHGVAHEEFHLTPHAEPRDGRRRVEGQRPAIAAGTRRDHEGIGHEQ